MLTSLKEINEQVKGKNLDPRTHDDGRKDKFKDVIISLKDKLLK